MRLIVALFVLALVPVVVAVSLVGFVIGTLRNGGAGVPVYVFRPWVRFHEICISGWWGSTWLKHSIGKLRGYLLWTERAALELGSTSFLTRIITRHSDPVNGPLQALWAGLVTIPILLWAVNWLGVPQHFSASSPDGFVANAWAWLMRVQPERTIWQWVAMFFLVIFILHAHTAIRDRCILLMGISAHQALLDVLKSGQARLVVQEYPLSLWPTSMFDTRFARDMHKNSFHNKYGKKYEPSPDYITLGKTSPNEALDVRYVAQSEDRVVLTNSYCLMNLAGTNHIVLNRKHNFEKVWDKFTLLHEFGHLNGNGMRASLIETGGKGLYLAPVLSVPILTFGFNSHAAIYASNLVYFTLFYTLFVTWKWKVWESAANAEMTADLFAFSRLDPKEIPHALKLRLYNLTHEIKAKTVDRAMGGKLLSDETWSLLGLKFRHFFLRVYSQRCGNDPVRWRRRFQNPPLQAKVLAAIAATFCMFAVFAGTVSFWFTGCAWVIAVVIGASNMSLYAQFYDLDQQTAGYYMLYPTHQEGTS